MRVIAYDVRDDEIVYLNKVAKELNIEIKICQYTLTTENVEEINGFDAISMITKSRVTKEIVDYMVEHGVKYIGTRSIGTDHIDIPYAKSKGIKICNVSYSRNGVAEFTVMFMLDAVKKHKEIILKQTTNNYALNDLIGRNLSDLTIGVIGTGLIGARVIELLSGFKTKILAYSRTEKDFVKQYATYTDLDTLLKESDIIALTTASNSETYHIVNRDSIAKMKDGVIIINTARGALIDTDALIEGLDSGKIAMCGLDVLENEESFTHKNFEGKDFPNPKLCELIHRPNVIYTQHMAFFTEDAVNDMTGLAMKGIVELDTVGQTKYML